jgi:hypothetical protein
MIGRHAAPSPRSSGVTDQGLTTTPDWSTATVLYGGLACERDKLLVGNAFSEN